MVQVGAGILWLSDAPSFDYNNLSEEKIQQLCKYFKSFCFAISPRHDIGLSHPPRKNFSDITKDTLKNDLTYRHPSYYAVLVNAVYPITRFAKCSNPSVYAEF